MTEANNVDKALTPKPAPDEWDDLPEPTERTTPSRLIASRGPDEYFATAHALGAELRARRREGTVSPDLDERKPWFDPAEEFDYDATRRAIENGELRDYYHALQVMLIDTKGWDKLPPKPDIDEWREPPGYPGYLLHSQTRVLRRPASTRVASNGVSRNLPEKVFSPKNGSYSLTVGDKTSSRGVNALWAETFPEFSRKKKRKKIVGEWDDTVRSNATLERTEGVPEWLESGGSHTESRPA